MRLLILHIGCFSSLKMNGKCLNHSTVKFGKIDVNDSKCGSIRTWLKIIEKHCFRGSVALHLCNNWIRLFV